MAVSLLEEYLRVDTSNPPGNELHAALFMKKVLEREGIPTEVDEFAPGRANLLATLAAPGPARKRALLLTNHMDVVPADASRWSVAPFGGIVKDGSMYGRGAVDMKSEGILQLVALVRLKREKVPLDRDVLFLATADEEIDFAGAARAVSRKGWGDRLRACELAIAEGGENRLGTDGKPEYFGMFEGNDPTKRLIAVANFNNDLGEYWEFSDQGIDPVDLSNEAYKFGVNYFIYGLIH